MPRNADADRFVLAALTTRPRDRHELAALTGLQPGRVSQSLTSLKEQGLAAKLAWKKWARANAEVRHAS